MYYNNISDYGASTCEAPFNWKDLCPDTECLSDYGFTLSHPDKDNVEAFYHNGVLWEATFISNRMIVKCCSLSYRDEDIEKMKATIDKTFTSSNSEIVKVLHPMQDKRIINVSFYWGKELTNSL